ncbi:hypothetical protein BaRGS_00040395, partial [Batillaria attramentaria]
NHKRQEKSTPSFPFVVIVVVRESALPCLLEVLSVWQGTRRWETSNQLASDADNGNKSKTQFALTVGEDSEVETAAWGCQLVCIAVLICWQPVGRVCHSAGCGDFSMGAKKRCVL